MEGYLFKKGRGDSSFGRRNWKRRWFELENQTLRYYDEIDSQGTPTGLRDTIDITGCLCQPAQHHEKKHCFLLKFPPNSGYADMLMQAPDAKLMGLWVKELSGAARGDNVYVPPNYAALYELLGLQLDENPSVTEISKAYRRSALRNHPDKGGDLVVFKEIQDAYHQITSHLEDIENEKLYDTVIFEAEIVKGGGDAGLGLVVTEDPAKRVISIKDLLPSLTVNSVYPPTIGTLRKGDILIGIRNEDVTHMPLTRVGQKLNESRVPMNTSVKLTFKRLVKKDDPEHALNPSSEADFNESSPSPSSKHSQSPNPSPRKPNSEPSPRFGAHHEDGDENPSRHMSHIDPVQYVAVLSENDELKVELNQRDKSMETMQRENEAMKEELLRYKRGYSEAEQQKKKLEQSLHHAYNVSKMTRDQMTASLQQMMNVSKKVIQHQTPDVTEEMKKILQAEQLLDVDTILALEEHVKAIKQAQRTAILATISMDNVPSLATKWSQEGDSVVRKLEKLEEKLKQHDLLTLSKTPTRSLTAQTPMLNPKRTAMMTHTHHVHPPPSPTHHGHGHGHAAQSVDNSRTQSPAVDSQGSHHSNQGPAYNYDPRGTKDFIKATYGGNDMGSIATSESSTTYPSSTSKSATSHNNARPLQMRSPRGFVFP